LAASKSKSKVEHVSIARKAIAKLDDQFKVRVVAASVEVFFETLKAVEFMLVNYLKVTNAK